jgi:hypothetical protein
MKSIPPDKNVAPYRLTSAVAEKRIRQIAETTSRIKWSMLTLDRMEEREIFDVDVLRVLRSGAIKGQPEPGLKRGEWKCKLVMNVRGSREIGVIVIVFSTDGLLVKTVEWEDLP